MSDNQFFLEKEEDVKIRPKKSEEGTTEYTPISSTKYLKIKLSSLGKLNAPEIIKVRNYTIDDALELSLAPKDDNLDAIINVLSKMIEGGFDPAYLHQEELKEILLNIYGNFWGQILRDYEYPYTEEELSDKSIPSELKNKILKDNFIPTVDIPIKSINTTVIKDEFKEPIIIKDPKTNQVVHFRLSRIGDIIEAKNYVNKKYLREDQEFSKIRKAIESNKTENIDFNEIKKFQNHIKKKVKQTAKVIEALTLLRVNSKVLHKLEDKISYVPKVDINFWKKYNMIVEKYGKFGIDSEVKVESPLTHKKVTRRFQFRFMDFIQTDEIQDNSELVVSFGD